MGKIKAPKTGEFSVDYHKSFTAVHHEAVAKRLNPAANPSSGMARALFGVCPTPHKAEAGPNGYLPAPALAETGCRAVRKPAAQWREDDDRDKGGVPASRPCVTVRPRSRTR